MISDYEIGDYWLTGNLQVVRITKINLISVYPISAVPLGDDDRSNFTFTKEGFSNYYTKTTEEFDLLKKITRENDPEYFI